MTKTDTALTIKRHKLEDFEPMRKAGRLTAMALDEVTPLVKEGTTTETIDKFFLGDSAR